MRYLIISDIHANLTAFEAVLADAEGQWDKIWCLGDVVGYGPDPNECVELLKGFEHISLSGNHDWAILDRLDLETFNQDAKEAITWSKEQLTEENLQFLEQLPSRLDLEDFTLAHASPRHPVWEYIVDSKIAAINFQYFENPYCLVGHTHSPVVFEQTENEVIAHLPVYDQPLPLNGLRAIINPGSVGQPRDTDSRAAYALLDSDKLTWTHKRIGYDIEATQLRMSQHDMPYRLIARLQYGW
jgi:diadenosine tetraphosphatase ApaH/serine/threonine PP2A family protein phosphatase